ncbi:MAG TPA: hypothetical protein DCR97_12915 [Deltaproteobacteria bacterium]|nr:hypothetical protein [Deltaproteobacteria bacterium]
MRNVLVLGFIVSVLCSCAGAQAPMKGGDGPAPFRAPESIKPACENRSVMQARTRQHYEDYYGTMMTTDPSTLTTRKMVYRWGITNKTPLEMAYFAAYVKPMGRFNRFNAKIYVDSNVKDSMTFFFRNGARDGEVLKSIKVSPGQTVGVDFEISGVKKMYVGSELRINHGRGARLIIGEPEFYNCR